jgi:hypothetical protein
MRIARAARGAIASIRQGIAVLIFRPFSNPQPHRVTMGKLEPATKTITVKSKKKAKNTPPTCDACHLQDAKFQITTDCGDIFLCGHHFRRHRLALIRYEVREL